MPLEIVRYLFDTQTTNTITPIPYTDSTTIGADNVRGSDFEIGSIVDLVAWCFDTQCDCPDFPDNGGTGQPPFPPVYPILFSSDLVYGREHFSADMKMIRGDTYGRTFIVFQDGQYYDLSNCSVRMTFKWAFDDSDADAFKILTEGAGITVTAPTEGTFTFQLEPADTSGLPPRRVELLFDAQVTDSQSNVYTVAYGKLIILPDVSVTTP